MTRPIRLRLESTRYPHWGRYSGIGQFASRLDPARFRYKVHTASDGDDDLPADIVHFLDGEHSGQYLPQWLGERRRVKLVASYHQPADLLPDLVPQAVAARFDRVVVVSPG